MQVSVANAFSGSSMPEKFYRGDLMDGNLPSFKDISTRIQLDRAVYSRIFHTKPFLPPFVYKQIGRNETLWNTLYACTCTREGTILWLCSIRLRALRRSVVAATVLCSSRAFEVCRPFPPESTCAVVTGGAHPP